MENKRIKLTEILKSIDFGYIINDDNTFSLRDWQSANYNDIEGDKFNIDSNLAFNIIDRVEIYIKDYYLLDIAERLEKECHDNIDITENYEIFLEKMQKYPDTFKNDLETMKNLVNPSLLDISDIIEEYEHNYKMYLRIDIEDETNEFIEGYKTKENVCEDATRFYHEHFVQDEDYDENFEVKSYEQAKDFWSANGYEIKEVGNKDFVCPICDSENVECSGSEISGLILSYHYYCNNCSASYDRDYNLVFNGINDILRTTT